MRVLIGICIVSISINSVFGQKDTSQTEAIEWLNEYPAKNDQRVKFFDFTNEVEFDFGIKGEKDSLEVYWNSSY